MADVVSDTLKRMSLEQKVGQLFLIGFPEKKWEPRLEAFIRDQQPGGFIFFHRNWENLDQLRSFTRRIGSATRQITGVEPFLAVDQEGGTVTRLPLFPALPSAHAVGSTGREDLARDLGEESGHLLRWAGFNMNLAPVLDLSDPAKPSFIGSRSFGGDPARSGALAKAYAEGLKQADVLPTGKHFPGLGATLVDVHKDVGICRADEGTFRQRDLKPFSLFAGIGEFSALMISQMSYPALDPSGRPAPFSSKIMRDLLRGEIGYRGLIVTDDLQMKGTSLLMRPSEGALTSLKAGSDIVMLSWSARTQERAIQRVIQAVRTGEWPEAELNQRVARILSAKAFLREDAGIPGIRSGPNGSPGTKRLEEIDLKLLDAQIQTLPKPALFDARPSSNVCVVSADERFLHSFREGRPRGTQSTLLGPQTTVKALTEALNEKCPSVVFSVNGAQTSRLLAALPSFVRQKTIAVNFGLPSILSSQVDLGGRIELGHPYLHAGFRIAQLLARKN